MDALMQELTDGGLFTPHTALSTYAVPNDKRVSMELQSYDPTKSFQKVSSQFINQDRVLVTLDWLQVRLTDSLVNQLHYFEDSVLELDGFRVEMLETGTPQFKYKGNVYFGIGEEARNIGLIQFGARQATLKGSMILQYHNTVFYDRELFTVYSGRIFRDLFKCLGCRFLNVTRADIAFDGVDFSSFLEEWAECRWTEIGVKNFYPRDYDIHKRSFKDFHVGAKSGTKYIRYYDKLEELEYQEKKGTPKQYIEEYFKANNFDLKKGVFRFEIRLTSKAFKDIENFEFEDLFEVGKLCSIVEHSIKNWFEFVPTDHSDSVVSRRPRLQMFDFSKVEFQKVYIKAKRKVGSKLRTVKVMVKRLLHDAYLSGEKTQFMIKTAADLVQNYHLLDWISSKSMFYLDEFKKEAKARAIIPNSIVAECDGLGGLCYDWANSGKGVYIEYDRNTGEFLTQKNISYGN
jgi:hypothetical protein